MEPLLIRCLPVRLLPLKKKRWVPQEIIDNHSVAIFQDSEVNSSRTLDQLRIFSVLQAGRNSFLISKTDNFRIVQRHTRSHYTYLTNKYQLGSFAHTQRLAYKLMELKNWQAEMCDFHRLHEAKLFGLILPVFEQRIQRFNISWDHRSKENDTNCISSENVLQTHFAEMQALQFFTWNLWYYIPFHSFVFLF